MTGRIKWQQCNECGWRLPDGAAGYPECAKCGAPMHIHSRPAEANEVSTEGMTPNDLVDNAVLSNFK
jgi:hypothetical protein